MNDVVYLSLSDYFDFIFPSIRELSYDDDAKKLLYKGYEHGVKNLNAVISLIQNDNYYPRFLDKATYLFVAISTGHYFPNGNKRLAFFSFVYFAFRNKYNWRGVSIEKCRKWFKKHFPGYKTSRQFLSTNVGWALYNFNKTINIKYPEKEQGHKYNFDEIKKVTKIFFKLILIKKQT